MLEAEQQGRCWEYSNLLFEDSQAMTDENMRLQAQEATATSRPAQVR